MSAIGCRMQRRQPALVANLDVGSTIQQENDDISMSGKRRNQQGWLARIVRFRYVSSWLRSCFTRSTFPSLAASCKGPADATENPNTIPTTEAQRTFIAHPSPHHSWFASAKLYLSYHTYKLRTRIAQAQRPHV